MEVSTLWLGLIVGSLLAATLGFIWVAVRVGNLHGARKAAHTESFDDAANKDVEHIFNEAFREELRNRGRLHFEKIIGENAMFLQQDLRLTTSELNEFMKKEITAKLKDEFAKYEESIDDAKTLAVEAIQKTKEAIDEERAALSQQLRQDVSDEKKRQIQRFEANMADVVNHYLILSLGEQIDLSDQLEYILANFESNKQAILEDIEHGS